MLLELVDRLVYGLLGLDKSLPSTQALHFFIYDSVKILCLLFTMIFAIGVLRTYLPQKKIRLWMNKRGAAGYFFASLFGAVTPFCSCSSIPFFFGFLEAGIPLGVALSFLITSPIINEYLVVLMLGFFGWKITLLYIFSGLTLGTATGYILGKMGFEKHLERDLVERRESRACLVEPAYRTFESRLVFGWTEAACIVRKIWIWVLAGVGLGAFIHNYVPQSLIESAISRTGFFSVPIAVFLGVPMYGSCAAIVPIAVVLFQKGIPLGTALAFMMAVAALSLPEAVMLRRAMRLPLILVFFGITAGAIIITGYVFNFLQLILS
ncbi:MAG: permease [Candidatus Omnitrophota bacterium]